MIENSQPESHLPRRQTGQVFTRGYGDGNFRAGPFVVVLPDAANDG